MSIMRNFGIVALAGLFAAPLSAQIVVANDPVGTARDRVEAARQRVEAARRRTETSRRRGEDDSAARRSGRASSKIPRGHLPPKGMCRVWIDGVPPGQQPPVTDCATAERNRTVNSRVIYGDRESFPGKGKGQFKNGDRDRDDDDRWDDGDRDEGVKLSKSEKKARKEARKGGRGRG